jgi:hypothetical protein
VRSIIHLRVHRACSRLPPFITYRYRSRTAFRSVGAAHLLPLLGPAAGHPDVEAVDDAGRHHRLALQVAAGEEGVEEAGGVLSAPVDFGSRGLRGGLVG